MDIVHFFESHRTDYLKAFEIMKARLTQNDFYVLTEPIDKEYSENGSGLFSFFRYDFLVKEKNSENYTDMAVNVNPTLFDLPQVLTYSSIEILMQSFVWNGSKFSFDTNIKIDFLNEWYEKSIQIDNEKYDSTIKNVIHRVTPIDDKTVILDFGTLGCEKIFELFVKLGSSGVSRMTIESVYE